MSTATAPVRQAPSGSVLRAVVRSEWTKLRTVRSTVWALVFTVVSMIGIGALLTALEVGRWDERSAADVVRFDPVLYSFGGVNLAELSVAVLGVLVMTSEYATGMIKLTLSATPARPVLLGAKVIAFGAVVAVVGLLSCVAAFVIGQLILSGKNADVSILDPGVLRAVLGAVLYLVAVGVIGVGVGALLRHTAAAVAVLVAVLQVIPGLVSLLPSPWNDDLQKFLPGTAGAAMVVTTKSPTYLSPAAGLIVLLGYVGVTMLAAGFVLDRRDA